MEVEDRESTDSGSLSGNPDSESPPLSGGDYVGHGGGVVPGVTSMEISIEKTAAGTNVPAVAVGGGGGGVGGGMSDGGGVLGGGSAGGRGGASGDLSMGKKKRGRPRKYDADGNLNPAYLKSPSMNPTGFTLSTPPSYENSSGPKRGRGKHSGTGSGNWQILASLGELFATTAGGDFTAHVVTVNPGEDAAGTILTFAQKGHRGICVLSANGSVSNVTLRQPGSSGGLLTYEGRFEILTLTGSYTVSDNGGIKSRSGGLSVSLASPDGRVIGGGVAGLLMAASPIQIVVGSFLPNGFPPQQQQQQKRKYNKEPKISPMAPFTAPATVTAATPISQAPPQTNTCPLPAPQTQFVVQNHGEGDNSLSNKDQPNSASTDTGDWNGSDQRPSPDINISIPEH